jgi:hypothetical protein
MTEIGEYDEYISGVFDERPVSFCIFCVEAMSEVVEEYYVHKYKEAASATVH